MSVNIGKTIYTIIIVWGFKIVLAGGTYILAPPVEIEFILNWKCGQFNPLADIGLSSKLHWITWKSNIQ